MPGVPTGRGCEACRNQKKKCDQIQPSCSRCTRLRIACVGCGKRRYKFVETRSIASRTSSLIRPTRQIPVVKVQGILQTPSNQMTMMTGAFLSALEVTDVRYELSIYGEFLKDIPRRLGTNPALDASVTALTSAFASVRLRQPSLEAFEHYVQALKVLRISLNDPTEVGSANTLCAVWLMMVCQGWIGQRDDRSGHGAGLAHLLNNIASRGCQNSFETALVNTLCVPVILESITNPTIQLDPRLWKLTESRDKSVPIEALKLVNLAKLPEYIRYPREYISEISSAYIHMAVDIPMMRRQLSNVAQQAETMGPLHARLQTAYGFLLAYALVLNILLRLFQPENTFLVEQASTMADEVVVLADSASQYRPLAASAMPMFLVAAWAAKNEEARRAKIQEMFAQYESDLAISSWMEMAFWLESRMKDHVPTKSSSLSDELGTPMEVESTCCPM